MNIVHVSKENVRDTGFLCMMSRKKSTGYQKKLTWLQARFEEGMKIKMLDLTQGGRGFIEYIPGEYAWRSINAEGYMVIHCLWVVGKSKGQGYGKLLLDQCLKDAKAQGLKGVAMVTSERVWLLEKSFLEKHGFEAVAQDLPFTLMVKKFKKCTSPWFTGNWEEKAQACGKGLTILRADQCPYIEDAVTIALDAAEEAGIDANIIEINDAQSLRQHSPTPFGVFAMVLDHRLLSYHYLTKKQLLAKLGK